MRSPISACGMATLFATAVSNGADGQQVRWSLHGEERRQDLGASLARLGDLDGDGVPDFAAGLTTAGDDHVPGTGAVSLRSGVDGGLIGEWSHATRATFGRLVAAVGDLDGDGVEDLLVGSLADATHPESVVFAHSGANGALLFDVRGAAGSGDRFGASLAAMGDLDRDGVPDFAVGIPSYNGSGTTGRVEFRSGSDRSLLGTVTGTSQKTRFGDTDRIAAAGDMDGDGVDDLWTAEIFTPAKPGAANCHVDLWSGSTTLRLLRATVLVSQWTGSEPLCLVAPGDMNGDGIGDAVVSVPRSSSGNRAGSAVAISGATGATLHTTPAPANGDLGRLCFAAGDVNGDGSADFGVTSDDGATEWISLRSGADGSELLQLADDAPGQQAFATAFAAGPDLDGDAIAELLIGSLPVVSGSRPAGSVQCRSLPGDATLWIEEGFHHDAFLRSDAAFLPDQDGDSLPELVTTESTSEYCNLTADRALVVRSGADGRELRREPLTGGLMGRFTALPDIDGDGVADFALGGVAEWAEYVSPPGYFPFDDRVELRSGLDLALIDTLQSNPPDDRFGHALAVVEQQSGAIHLAVGSPRRDVASVGDQLGRIDVFDVVTGKRVFHVDGVSDWAHARFGSAIAAVGDVDGDGTGDWAVGSPGWGTFHYTGKLGRVVVVSGASGAELVALEEPTIPRELGANLVVIGDQDGDGLPELAIHSRHSSSSLTGDGMVELCRGRTLATYATLKGATAGAQLGRNLAAIPDANGDGLDDFMLSVAAVPGVQAARLELRAGDDGRLLHRIELEEDALVDAWFGVTPPAGMPSRAPGGDGPWVASCDVSIGLDGTRTGRIALLELDDLYLEITPSLAPAGATASATVRGGPAGALAGLLLATINGAPVNLMAALGTLDAEGSFALSDTVPPGLSGQVWTLRGYSIGFTGKLTDSQDATLTFQ